MPGARAGAGSEEMWPNSGATKGPLRTGDQKEPGMGRKNHQCEGPEARQTCGNLRVGRKPGA